MKILVMSDLHLETQNMPKVIWPEHDIVLLVGDIANGTEGIVWAKHEFQKPVLYITGNHEFYRKNWADNLEGLRQEALLSNVTFLENDTFIFDNVLFIGATLWTDFNLFQRPDDGMNYAQISIRDFNRIYNGHHYILPEDMIKEHTHSKNYIKKVINETSFKKIIVATHFGISHESINPIYAGDKLNPYFASDLSQFIIDLDKPLTWVFGHTHTKTNYSIGKTKVFSNPMGYPGEMEKFEPLVLDTEQLF